MKTLDECKQLVANRLNCANWGQVLVTLKRSDLLPIDSIINELSEMYAREVAGQALKDASERATAHVYYHPEDRGEPSAEVDKDSITSPPIVTM